MGTDKAQLQVDGVPQAKRIADLLNAVGIPVTILGRNPIEGMAFLPDLQEYRGPLSALSRFKPSAPYVFVASCDLPRFDPKLVNALRAAIGSWEASVPVVDGYRQPFCALYSASAFERLTGTEDPCAMSWLDAMRARLVGEDELLQAGVSPGVARGANTPEEFDRAMQEASV